MTEGITCYERDEALCEDQMCLLVGCRLRNKRLLNEMDIVERLRSQATSDDSIFARSADEITRLRSELEQAKGQVEKLIRTGQLLLENSVGCAVKHHGLKPSDDLPGWLADAKADIEAASAAFPSTERP